MFMHDTLVGTLLPWCVDRHRFYAQHQNWQRLAAVMQADIDTSPEAKPADAPPAVLPAPDLAPLLVLREPLPPEALVSMVLMHTAQNS